MPQGSHGWMADIRKVVSFDSVEEFWGLYNNIIPPSQLPGKANYYLFKVGSFNGLLFRSDILIEWHYSGLGGPSKQEWRKMVYSSTQEQWKQGFHRQNVALYGKCAKRSPFSVIYSWPCTVDACCNWRDFWDTLHRVWNCPFPHTVRSHHWRDRLSSSCLVSCCDPYFTSRVSLETHFNLAIEFLFGPARPAILIFPTLMPSRLVCSTSANTSRQVF